MGGKKDQDAMSERDLLFAIYRELPECGEEIDPYDFDFEFAEVFKNFVVDGPRCIAASRRLQIMFSAVFAKVTDIPVVDVHPRSIGGSYICALNSAVACSVVDDIDQDIDYPDWLRIDFAGLEDECG